MITPYRAIALLLLAWPGLFLPSARLAAQTTAFTYQGRLTDNGRAAEGSYDFRFFLHHQAAGGAGSDPLVVQPVLVTRGVFSVTLDFGTTAFTGDPRWLEIQVRTNGSAGAYATLTPRQRVTAAPYAIFATSPAGSQGPAGPAGADGPPGPAGPPGTTSADALTNGILSDARLSTNVALLNGTNAFGGPVTLTNLANRFAGDGSGLFNVPGAIPWQTVAETGQVAQANRAYLLTNSALSSVWLPGTANLGDLVTVAGSGNSGWVVAATNAGQRILGAPVFSSATRWEPRENQRDWRAVASSADGSKLVAVVYDGFIYTSTDAGLTWTEREAERDWISVASSADGARLVAVEEGGRIYTSTDAGLSWAGREEERDWISVASSADGTKLVAADYGGRIYTSVDGGLAWVPREEGHDWISVASSADGAKLVALEEGGRIYTSTDSGTTWEARGDEREWSFVASSADGTRLAATEWNGRIYISADRGATWIARGDVRRWTSVAVSADGNILLAMEYNGAIHGSSDGGVTWVAMEEGRKWAAAALSADGAKLVAVAFDERIFTLVTGTSQVTGEAGSSVTLQYTGYGQWQSLASTPIAGYDASRITSGSLSIARLPGGVALLDESNTFSQRNYFDGATILDNPDNRMAGDGSRLDRLDAGKLTRGTLDDQRLSSNVALRSEANVFAGPNEFSGEVLLGNAANQLAGNGAAITGLNAANLAAGTLDDARLSANVALLGNANLFGGSNTFTGSNHFGGIVMLTNAGNVLAGDGSGLVNVPGTLVWHTVSSAYQQAVANSSYLFTNPASASLFLPIEAKVGEVVSVGGTGGWKVSTLNAGQGIVGQGIFSTPGENWVAHETDRVWSFAASSADGAQFYAGNLGIGLYASRDSGGNWFRLEAPPLMRLVVSADGRKLVGAQPGGNLFTSDDFGSNWTLRATSGTGALYAIASSADGDRLIVAGGGEPIQISSDSGVTFVSRDEPRPWAAVASSADGGKLVAGEWDGKLYTSADAGETWTPHNVRGYWNTIASSADGTRLAANDQNGTLYISTDSGDTWTPRHSHRYCPSVASSADGNVLMLAEVEMDGRLYLSIDGGSTWTAREIGRRWSYAAMSGDGSKMVAVVQGGRIYTSTGNIPLISGPAGSTATLQYIGNGQWQPLAGAQIAADAIGNDQVAGLDAAKLTSGTLAGERLPASLAWQNGANAFTGMNVFSGATRFTGSTLFVDLAVLTNAANMVSGYGAGLTALNASELGFGTVPNERLSGVYSLPLSLENSGNVLGGDGQGLKNLNATQLSLGTVADARLSTNVALQGGANVFGGANRFAGVATITNVANVLAGNGAGLTGLNAANLSVGTLNDARLSANVALQAGANVFTGAGRFAGATMLTNTANVLAGNGASVTELSAGNVTTGTLDDARLSANVAFQNGANVFSGANRFMATTLLTNIANVLAGNGASVTGLNAANVNIGALNDARLSSNVTLLNGTNVFSGTNRFAGSVWLTNTANVLAGNGGALTGLNASSLGAGTVSDARLSANVALLNGTNTFTGPITLTNTGNVFAGTGAGLVNVPGAIPWQTVTGAAQSAVVNHAYLLTNPSPSVVSLPTAPQVGDMVTVTGSGAGGWSVRTRNAGQGITGAGRYSPPGEVLVARESNRTWRTIVSSADGSKLVAASIDGGVFTSSDGGVSWIWRVGPLAMDLASSADCEKLVVTGQNGFLYTSADGGATWTQRAISANWDAVASSADGNKLVATAFNGRIYTSTDAGENWTPRDVDRLWNAVASSADGTKLVATVNGGRLYTSTDAGESWVARDEDRGWSAVASSADGTKLVASAGLGTIYTSEDSGVTWVAKRSPGYWLSVAISADGSVLAAADFDTGTSALHVSTDGGTTWTRWGTGLPWVAVALSSDGFKLAAVTQGERIYTSVGLDAAINGPAGATATLQYVGDGQWQPLAASQIGAGTVGNAQVSALDTSKLTTGSLDDARLSANVALLDRVNVFTATSRFAGLAAQSITADTFVGDGSGLTGLNASNLATGTVNDTRLSANVTFQNGANIFTGTNQFSGLAVLTNVANVLAGDGSGLTGLNATRLDAGTVADARLSGNVALQSGANIFTGPNQFAGIALLTNTANIMVGDGSGLVGLNATRLSSGTVDDVRLSANVAFRNGTNVFTGTNQFSGVTLLGNAANTIAGDGSGLTGLNAANLAAGLLPDARLAGTFSSAITLNNAANNLAGNFSGNGVGLTNVPGALPWQVAPGTEVATVSSHGYLVTNAAQVNVSLPVAPVMGDVIRISAPGAGGVKITQNAGQSIGTRPLPPSPLGVNWTAGATAQDWQGLAASADGTKLVAAVRNGNLFTSTDSGTTWTARATTRAWSCVAASADGGKLVAANTDQRSIYFSTNGGNDWSPLVLEPSDGESWRALAISHNGEFVVGVGGGGYIWTRESSASSMIQRTESSRSYSGVAASASGVKLAACVFNGPILLSSDYGANWLASGAGTRNWTSIASSADGTKLAATADGKVYLSADTGLTWAARAAPLATVASSSDGTRLAGVNGASVYLSTDSGVTWYQRANLGAALVVSSADGFRLAATGPGNPIYTATPVELARSATTTGVAGSLVMDADSALELQYVGNGRFVVLSYAGSFTAN